MPLYDNSCGLIGLTQFQPRKVLSQVWPFPFQIRHIHQGRLLRVLGEQGLVFQIIPYSEDSDVRRASGGNFQLEVYWVNKQRIIHACITIKSGLF